MRIRLFSTVLLAMIAFPWIGMAQIQTLIQTNTTWSFKRGTNEASSPITLWRQLSWPATDWESGRTPFHYGEGLSTGTTLSNMRSNYSCIYLRRVFSVQNSNQIGTLTLTATSDDGFIAWINGTEVARFNVTDQEPGFRTVASTSAPDPAVPQAYPLPDPRSYLVEGDNILTIQAFNQHISSSTDFQFNASLTALPPDLNPPFITGIEPPPGRVPLLHQITTTFSEPVQGVEASDFWINGSPAKSVEGNGTVYTFFFDPAPFGTAYITWYSDHGIRDTSFRTNSFDSSSSNANWQYEVLDDQPPRIITLNPPPNSTVRQLAQLEIGFDEPVQGLTAQSLLINGSPASTVKTNSDSQFTFMFTPSAAGEVVVRWNPNHTITDLQDPPNRFGGSDWNYSVSTESNSGNVVINEFLTSNISASGLLDEDRELQGWIELYNPGTQAVSIRGWSLTDDPDVPDQWILPDITLGGRQYLVIFASGKDRRTTTSNNRLHTNFKLSPEGEYLGLYNAESPRVAVSEIKPAYPSQRNDYSYGRDSLGDWRYFKSPTPGAANGTSTISGVADEPHFSVQRGFFNQPFDLTLASQNPGAVIRYTLNGSPPGETNGFVYRSPITIRTSSVIRAAAFLSNSLPSKTSTHTYLLGLSAARLSLPVVSIVTSSNNLRGPTGIMEINPQNTTKRGIAWERPSSVEWIRPTDNSGFQIDCGLRIQGGDYIRGRYNPNTTTPPEGKFSFRLYFRGDYGPGKLRYPLFEDSPVQEFDRIVLRAGMNDPTNPFLVDEMVRRLAIETGQVSARGTFAHLFLNGVYKGYYNPTEGYEEDFFQSWHGGGRAWDLITQAGGLNAGDRNAFNTLNNLITRSNLNLAPLYAAAEKQLDMTNFVDYLLVNIYGGTGDWPHNNWRAARERIPGSKFRFYIWDAEWAMGNLGRAVNLNTLTGELANGSEIANFYQRLRLNEEFKTLFADRIQKHFFNEGALTDSRITNLFTKMRNELRAAIPDLQTAILTTWVPRRRTNIFNHLRTAGLFASSNAPVFSQHGGRVPSGYKLSITNLEGNIYYTTDGSDPRIPVSKQVHPNSLLFTKSSPIPLTADTQLKARSLAGTNWSALTEATFTVGRLGSPVRISEIHFNPPGGDQFEFIEITSIGATPVNIGHYSFEGIRFSFPENTLLNPGQRLVIGSDVDPRTFTNRYPTLKVSGYFSGALANKGERIALIDPSGQTVVSVDYSASNGWPSESTTRNASIEIIDPAGNPDDPANWQATPGNIGTPGFASPPPPARIEISEVLADNLQSQAGNSKSPDWIELHNPGTAAMNLAGWSLSDDGMPGKFTFPTGTSLAAGDFLVVWMDAPSTEPGFHASFSLEKSGESVFLFDSASNRIDAVSFGPQLPDLSIAKVQGTWTLASPTPGRPNVATQTAPPSDLILNELLANPLPGQDDWVEIFNRNQNLPASLQGIHISTPTGSQQIQSLSFIAPGGFLQLTASQSPAPLNLDLKLPAGGGFAAIHDPSGIEMGRLTYGPQKQGVSFGRIPDGSSSLAAFQNSGSAAASNYLPNYSGPRLNELVAYPAQESSGPWDEPTDWIELYNPSASSFDLSGMSLSSGNPAEGEWNFPEGTKLPGNGYLLIWMSKNHPASTTATPPLNSGLSLSHESDGVYLFNAAGQMVDSIEFGFQVKGLSLGVSAGAWQLLATPSPGTVNGPAASLGSTSSLRLNEWMASPVQGPDWLELHNLENKPVELSGLYLTDDPSISGITNTWISAHSFIGAKGFVQFIADGRLDQGRNHLRFSLDGLGETLRLYGTGFSIIDETDLGVQIPGISEGRMPDGGERIIAFTTGATPALPNQTTDNLLKISSVEVQGDSIIIDFPSAPFTEYQVQSTTALEKAAWIEVTKVPSKTGFEQTRIVVPRFGNNQQFFRLMINP